MDGEIEFDRSAETIKVGETLSARIEFNGEIEISPEALWQDRTNVMKVAQDCLRAEIRNKVWAWVEEFAADRLESYYQERFHLDLGSFMHFKGLAHLVPGEAVLTEKEGKS